MPVSRENHPSDPAATATTLSDAEKFQLLAENITDVFWIRSGDMRELHYLSPAFERIWGRSREELLSSPDSWMDYIVPEDREFARRGFEELVRTGKPLKLEYRILRPDGEIRWVQTRGFQVRDEEGRPTRMTGIVTDVTDRRESEIALRRSEEEFRDVEAQLRQAQKMEAIGQLAAGVAHEFNNLLQGLMAMATLTRLRGGPELASTGATMEAEIRRGATLTRQLLLFSQQSVMQRSEFDLRDGVEGAAELLRHLLPETISLTLETGEDALPVDADAGQIQQVLVNLAINARDAMPEGGRLTLRAGRSGGEAFAEVEDTGEGIDATTRSRIFEPFFTTRRGTGLGLSVAYGIVDQHGGRIDVSSSPGSGSRFRVVLPLLAVHSQVGVETTAEEEAESVTAGTNAHLLLVEDEPAVREGLVIFLEMAGYEVTAFASAEEALDASLPHTPASLVSDLSLPGMSGFVLAQRMIERYPSLRVTLMSGYMDDSTHAERPEGWQFLQKPFELDDLLRCLAAG